jgi:hypothetical protein
MRLRYPRIERYVPEPLEQTGRQAPSDLSATMTHAEQTWKWVRGEKPFSVRVLQFLHRTLLAGTIDESLELDRRHQRARKFPVLMRFTATANPRVRETSLLYCSFAMHTNAPLQQTSLVDALVAWLRERLPETWTVERPVHAAATRGQSQRLDDVVSLRAPNGTSTMLAVDARQSLQPREVDHLLPALARSLRALAGDVPLVLVAPWLSPRVQELLAAQQINYVDLTGNALVKLDNPALFIQSTGASRSPKPAGRANAGLRGPRAARLIRLLADVSPPYGVRELALAAEITPGYVSRLLETLDRDAIVRREHRGRVTSVDVPALLRAWAASYDVFKTNAATPMLAPNGAADTLGRLAAVDGALALTGSFAAVRLAPVAAPALLLVYCDHIESTARALELLPAQEGANVVLLKPFDEVVWQRTTSLNGIRCCAPSQVAVDCLTGNGRMPSEGEALVGWMTEHETSWRAPSLSALPTDEGEVL